MRWKAFSPSPFSKDLFTILLCWENISSHISIIGYGGDVTRRSTLSSESCSIWPESEKPETLGRHIRPHYEKPDNLFLAIVNGAQEGVKVILAIVALLVAVLGLTALFDLFLGKLFS